MGAVERSLRVLRPGDLFGETALIEGAPRSSTAVALADGVALALDQATFEQVLSGNPAVGARVLHQLIRRLRDAEDQIEILMLRDSQSKIVVSLLKLAHQSERQPGDRRGDREHLADGAVDAGRARRRHGQAQRPAAARERLHRHRRASAWRSRMSRRSAELYGLLGVKDQIVGGEPSAPRERSSH